MSRVLSEFSQERNAMPAQYQAICHMKQRYTLTLTNTNKNKNNKTNDNHQQQNGLLIVMALVMRITMTVDAGHDPIIVITIMSMTLHRIYQSKRTHTSVHCSAMQNYRIQQQYKIQSSILVVSR